MNQLQTATIQCPYCGEPIEVEIDCSIPSQEYIEDCSVCCRPIVLSATCGEGEVSRLEARTEDD